LKKILFVELKTEHTKPFKDQLLKWVGNKQRFAHEIVSSFPKSYNKYFEPFLGSGAVLATLQPKKALASDVFKPLMEIWVTLKENPELLKQWYKERWEIANGDNKKEGYEKVKASYNSNPNGADFVFLSRSCYGGVIRFRQKDGYMSTPCGPHNPMPPDKFSARVDLWRKRIHQVEFKHMDYREAMRQAEAGDLIYCDPPYHHSQSILYGGQSFRLEELFEEIKRCKDRGVYVALSIDGTKKSGDDLCELPIPDELFEEEIFVNVGRSMLRRFQMEGKTLHNEVVSDRLLLTYKI
jgi:DNA adenine methylase